MKNNYRLKKVDPLTYKDEDWNDYFDFRTKSYALMDQPMPFKSVEDLRQRNTGNIKNTGDEIYQVWKNEQEFGTFYFSIEYKDDLEKRFTYLNNMMHDNFIEANLLEIIFEKFIDYDEESNSLAILSADEKNDFVTDLYQARLGSIFAFYELNIKEANIEKIDTWLAEAPAKFPNLRIEMHIQIPDDLLEEYAAFYMELYECLPPNSYINDVQITAESLKSVQESGIESNDYAYRYMIFNEDNQLIAKTYAVFNTEHPQVMLQFMTGVKKEYRGLGLSKWLKAAMFKRLTTDFPELEKIKTEAHPDNHASVQLSKQMGYKQIGAEKEFLIDRSFIEQYLNI